MWDMWGFGGTPAVVVGVQIRNKFEDLATVKISSIFVDVRRGTRDAAGPTGTDAAAGRTPSK